MVQSELFWSFIWEFFFNFLNFFSQIRSNSGFFGVVGSYVTTTTRWPTCSRARSSASSWPGVISVSMSLITFLFWSTTSSSLRSFASWSGPIVTGAAATGDTAGAPWVGGLWGGGWDGPWNHEQTHFLNCHIDTVTWLSFCFQQS